MVQQKRTCLEASLRGLARTRQYQALVLLAPATDEALSRVTFVIFAAVAADHYEQVEKERAKRTLLEHRERHLPAVLRRFLEAVFGGHAHHFVVKVLDQRRVRARLRLCLPRDLVPGHGVGEPLHRAAHRAELVPLEGAVVSVSPLATYAAAEAAAEERKRVFSSLLVPGMHDRELGGWHVARGTGDDIVSGGLGVRAAATRDRRRRRHPQSG